MGLFDCLTQPRYVLLREISGKKYQITATISHRQRQNIFNNESFTETTFNKKDCMSVEESFSYGNDNGIQTYFIKGDLIMRYNDWIAI